MADISQIEVNGTTYDICDATARDSLSQRVFYHGHVKRSAVFTQGDFIALEIDNKDNVGYVFCTNQKGAFFLKRPNGYSDATNQSYIWRSLEGMVATSGQLSLAGGASGSTTINLINKGLASNATILCSVVLAVPNPNWITAYVTAGTRQSSNVEISYHNHYSGANTISGNFVILTLYYSSV